MNNNASDTLTSNAELYLSQAHAIGLDKRLFAIYDPIQLIELAGQSVAHAAFRLFKEKHKVLIVCGKGNNGNDGIAAARHMKLLGFEPTVLLAGNQKTDLLSAFDVVVVHEVSMDMSQFDLVVDALLGFGARGPARSPYDQLIARMAKCSTVLSIDVPSGWDVECGDIYQTKFVPQAVVSLSAPKLCMKTFSGVHLIGGRFVPPKIAAELKIENMYKDDALFSII